MNVRVVVANALFVLHVLIGLVILFGWLYAPIRPLYLALLILWPLCWLVFGFCPLSKWEFQLRGINIKDTDLNGEIISYYARKLFGVRIPAPFIFGGGLVLLGISVVGNVLYVLNVGHF